MARKKAKAAELAKSGYGMPDGYDDKEAINSGQKARPGPTANKAENPETPVIEAKGIQFEDVARSARGKKAAKKGRGR